MMTAGMRCCGERGVAFTCKLISNEDGDRISSIFFLFQAFCVKWWFRYDAMMRFYIYCGFGHVPPEAASHDDVKLTAFSLGLGHSGYRCRNVSFFALV